MVISIHPMLLFIRHCRFPESVGWIISIHPMLLFIVMQSNCVQIVVEFQYIPCYCLSRLPVMWEQKKIEFQYIPCYCLSNISVLSPRFCFYFNTSHVTVYPDMHPEPHPADQISIHPMLLFIFLSAFIDLIRCNFNTSHVTVYLNSSAFLFISSTFQYIPCYCLSFIVFRSS